MLQAVAGESVGLNPWKYEVEPPGFGGAAVFQEHSVLPSYILF